MYRFSWNPHSSDRMLFTIPLFLVLIGTTEPCSPKTLNRTDLRLDCSVDWDDVIQCSFDGQNCSEHVLRKARDQQAEKQCVPARCSPHSARCCCSIPLIAIIGASHTMCVLRGGRGMDFKVVDVKGNIKPKTPTISSVRKSNGDIEIKWSSRMTGLVAKALTPEVTFRKKGGGEEKIYSSNETKTVGDVNVFEIPAEDLESSSTYQVRMRSLYPHSGRFSDPSKEFEFKTPMSHSSLLLSLIVSLSIVAVLIAGAAIYCYVKVKKVLDNCPNPQINIKPYQKEFLKPERLIASSVSIEPLFPYESKSWMKETLSDTHSGNMEPSSGFSTGSSCLSYANTEMPDFTACQHEALRKAFPIVSPVGPPTGGLSPAHCGPKTADPPSGQFSFENKFYAVVNPVLPPLMTMDGSEASTQMVCVSEYHSDESDVAAQDAPALPALALSAAVPSALATDMSYQPCGQDSGLSSGFSDSSTILSCDITVEAGGASTVEGARETTRSQTAGNFDEDPRREMSAPNSFPLVEDSYQSFQSLVSQPVPQVEEYSEQHPINQIPDSTSRVPSGQCLPEAQRAFFTLLSTNRLPAVFTDSGYERA